MDHPEVAKLLISNEQWAADVTAADPTFFKTSAEGQHPKVLWIGCADSRVPESVITASRPGDIFTHRNIANQFPVADDSSHSVLDYAVGVVGVEHVVLVGHSNCGGVGHCYDVVKDEQQAKSQPNGPILRWLTPLINLVRDLGVVSLPKPEAMSIIANENVKMQVENLVRTDTIRNTWIDPAKKPVQVHGWLYHLENGRLEDLGISLGPESLKENC